MTHLLTMWLQQSNWFTLIILISLSIYVLGKSADLLVELGVQLSLRWNIPKLIIGTTIISLGTTLPEVTVSVMAAMQGKSGIALGNAVGSIICDTGLILGLAIIIGKVPINKSVTNRQGLLQLLTGFLLVIACLKYFSIDQTFRLGGELKQEVGVVFLALLGLYFFFTSRWAKKTRVSQAITKTVSPKKSYTILFIKLILMMALLAMASEILILSASEIAERLMVPQSIIAVSVVAFGTSLPELVTVLSAVRKHHGELALGNIIGADILNVLLVTGSAAAFSPSNITVDPIFFKRSFPIMLLVLITLRLGIFWSDKHLKKPVGFILVLIYLLITTLNINDTLT